MNKVLLMILDGWGIGKHDKTDAIFNTPTPFMDSLSEKYPHAQTQLKKEQKEITKEREKQNNL